MQFERACLFDWYGDCQSWYRIGKLYRTQGAGGYHRRHGKAATEHSWLLCYASALSFGASSHQPPTTPVTDSAVLPHIVLSSIRRSYIQNTHIRYTLAISDHHCPQAPSQLACPRFAYFNLVTMKLCGLVTVLTATSLALATRTVIRIHTEYCAESDNTACLSEE